MELVMTVIAGPAAAGALSELVAALGRGAAALRHAGLARARRRLRSLSCRHRLASGRGGGPPGDRRRRDRRAGPAVGRPPQASSRRRPRIDDHRERNARRTGRFHRTAIACRRDHPAGDERRTRLRRRARRAGRAAERLAEVGPRRRGLAHPADAGSARAGRDLPARPGRVLPWSRAGSASLPSGWRAISVSSESSPIGSSSPTAGSPEPSWRRSLPARRNARRCWRWPRNAAVARSATLAVGDGANDLPMLAAAGLGIAFRAKPAVAAAARWRIDHADLTALLYAQGYRADEIVGG